MKNEYTNVVDESEDFGPVWSCNDCGAHANKPKNVKHHNSCNPGESAKWQKYYEDNDDPDIQ